ncbi:hypothetical protein A3860_33290 [Niastella vici]|uniref:Porin n=1 Tax=Niastella vici TaxID=1703345 RepID=A0A1V9FQE1_9BACT|nr:hypothetical protein [Niastella vici]OQP60538.1 hypothetical protein A3860_33290 [Niastella vici]
MTPVKTITRLMIFTLVSSVTTSIVNAQLVTAADSALIERVAALEKQVADIKPAESHFMVVGLATFGYVSSTSKYKPPSGPHQIIKTNSFPDADRYEFSPMLLWRHGTKWLLEFEPSYTGGNLEVNWADLSYYAAPGLIIRGGYFVLPFGIYNRRLAAGWINKLAPDPEGIDLPGTDFGIEVSGGLPLGNMKWSYAVSLTNGLQLLPDGELQTAGVTDNNTKKTVCGRLGLLPFSNSSLEIGISGLYGGTGDADSRFSKANSTMYGVDLNYVKTFTPILINVKGQYNRSTTDNQQYIKPTDSTLYTFDNKSSSAFAQISIRPVSAESNLVKNLELAFRYVNFKTPENSNWGQKYNEEDIGLDYWLSWRSVLKFTYAWTHSTSTANVSAGGIPGTTDTNNLYLQFSIQL